MSDLPQIPSAWAVYLPIATGLARHLLGVAGAAGFTWALAVNADQVQMAVSALFMLASAVWSAWQKIDAARKARAAAVTSAEASARATEAQGRPVAVVVGPKAAA